MNSGSISQNVKKGYELLSKTSGQPYHKYRGYTLRVTTNIPYTVEEVIVGVKGHSEQKRKITTFRDSNGNIIERALDFFDKPFKNRTYKKDDNIINNDEFVNSTTINTYTLGRNHLNEFNRFVNTNSRRLPLHILWNRIKVQTNHVSENINNGQKIFSKVCIEHKLGETKNTHSFIEYAPIGSSKRIKPTKLEFKVDRATDKIVIGSLSTQKVRLTKNDNYLPFRAMDLDAFKERITYHFLKKRKLEKANILVNPYYIPAENEEHLISFYEDYFGSINYNKLNNIKSKSRIAKSSAHEVEHAWQWFLKARNSGGDTPHSREIFQNFGTLTKPEERIESIICSKAIDEYVPFNKDLKQYKESYLEIKANEAGGKASDDYTKQGKQLRNAFKHIPEDFM